jgi:glucose/arabinose dehydrogenase
LPARFHSAIPRGALGPSARRRARIATRVALACVAGLASLVLAVGFACAVTVPSGFVVESAAPGAVFDTPVGIAFFPSGRLLVGEKSGRLFTISNGVVFPTPLWDGRREVLNIGDRGLLDVAVDPNYVTNHYIYLLYTVDPDSDDADTPITAFSRLTRYQVSFTDSNALDLSSRAVLIGATWSQGIPSGSQSHTIGCLRWGSDGTLLVSAGEGAIYSQPDQGGQYPSEFGPGKADPYQDIGAFRAQFVGSMDGKVLRVDPATGLGLPSNPYWDGDPASARSRVWAYGFRNPFRFAIRPGGSTVPGVGRPGSVYIGDVGWDQYEEINVAAQPGMNFGWPCFEGNYPQPQYQSATPSHCNCSSPGTSENPAQPTLPMASWSHYSPDWGSPPGMQGRTAIAGCFYTDTHYPAEYRNRFFFADFTDGWVRVMTMDVNENIVSVQDFGSSFDGPVDFITDPANGDIYYVSIYTGEVRRIRYTAATGTNRAPVVVANATPTTGVKPLTVSFSSAGTYDPDGDALTLSWFFGDLTGSSAANPSHTYTNSGVFGAVLTADDGHGGVTSDTVVVTATEPSSDFPSTAVLDDFNRADGAIGASWSGSTGTLKVSANALTENGTDGWGLWMPSTFGSSEEAYFTLNQVTASAPEHDLMLKVQGTSWSNGEIEVRYDATAAAVFVSTYAPSQGWVQRGASIPLTLAAGDQFGARTFPDGTIQVYVNGVLEGTRSASGWPFLGSNGRIGLQLVGASATRLDNFGGGDVAQVVNTRPHASILAPADGAFFVTNDVIPLHGAASDSEQSSASLQYHWQVNLHHNTHIHPSVYVTDGTDGSFTALDHEDGTGIWFEIQLQVTDDAGLRDTAMVGIYPETDV